MTIDASKLRALLEAATARPWKADLDCFNDEDGIVACVTDEKIDLLCTIDTDLKAGQWDVAKGGQELRDADLIVAAVNALPELLAVYEAACAWRDLDKLFEAGLADKRTNIGDAEQKLADAIDAARKEPT